MNKNYLSLVSRTANIHRIEGDGELIIIAFDSCFDVEDIPSGVFYDKVVAAADLGSGFVGNRHAGVIKAFPIKMFLREYYSRVLIYYFYFCTVLLLI